MFTETGENSKVSIFAIAFYVKYDTKQSKIFFPFVWNALILVLLMIILIDFTDP